MTLISSRTMIQVDSVTPTTEKSLPMQENISPLVQQPSPTQVNLMNLVPYSVLVVLDLITSITQKQQRKSTSRDSKIISGQNWIF
jgi:hypothetical protein